MPPALAQSKSIDAVQPFPQLYARESLGCDAAQFVKELEQPEALSHAQPGVGLGLLVELNPEVSAIHQPP